MMMKMDLKNMGTPLTDKERILKGVNILVDTVKVTLGAKGKNVMFSDTVTRKPRITKDGVTVAKHVTSTNPLERMAIEIVREASEQTVKTSGDGTTTTAIMAQYIINEGSKQLNKGKSFYELSRELDEAKELAVKMFTKASLLVESNFDKLLNVATVSASCDIIGQFIFDIIKEIGIYGHIEVKSSNSVADRIDKVKGIKYHKGFYAPQFLTNLTRMEWRASNAYIVLLDDTVRTMGDLQPYILTINGDEDGQLVHNHPILFVVNDVEPTVLQTLINNKLMYPAQFNIMITEHDGFGDRRIEIMNDIGALTGASRSTVEEPGEIGFAKEIIVDEDYTSILEGAAELEEVADLIKITKNRLLDADITPGDKLYYRRRLSTLAGGVAVIHVGAPTEVEMKEKKDRIDDAVEAVKSSIDRGISEGGGYTLLHTATEITRSGHDKMGHQIIVGALVEPFKQLCKNSDVDYLEIMDKILTDSVGYDVVSNLFSALDDYTIFDPTGVLIDSVTNAVSVAKSILSIEKAIIND